MITDDELAAMRARTNAATEGPWEAVKLYDVTDSTYIDGCDFAFNGDINVEVERAGLEYPEWVMIGPDSPPQKQIHADAEFIANARADMTALLDEVERLRTENAMLTESSAAWQRSSAWATGVLEFVQANADLFGVQAGDWLMPNLANVLARWVEAHRAGIEALK